MDEIQVAESVAGSPEKGLETEQAFRTLIPVVGIGASAGGLEVFRQLLSKLPRDTGFAFVVVQHLDPSHQSLLPEILARATDIPVSEAANGMPLEADHVYVIPANVDLTLADGALHLARRTQAAGTHMPIDQFLRSVAEQCGRRAIGIILSGTGSDGSAGVEAIKAAGGMTFAQEASTAKFPAMPAAAVATDCVDLVLSPDGIAEELVRIARHPYLQDGRPDSPTSGSAGDEAQFGSILAILRGATGIDFSLYREKMIKRRIRRRLALRNVGGLAEYCELLKSHADEVTALQRDLLIGVTGFFRDPESFERLKTVVFPPLFRGRAANEPIRVWVAGCATGEEAYSIAISLREYMAETGVGFPVQIFASDINAQSVEKARAGRYPENIAGDLTPERVNRYFTKTEGGYEVCKTLREMCLFTRHNLIDDPPFSRLDLISCRNVLIYLGSVQKYIIPLFHYALKPTGFLMLGASEAAAFGELFSVADREHRIFARRDAVRRQALFPRSGRSSQSAVMPGVASQVTAMTVWDSADLRKEVDRILLSKYSPTGVVVGEDLEVIEIRGKASPWLTLPTGKVSFNLMKLIPDTGVFLEVEKLIRRVRDTGEPARQERVLYEQDGRERDFNLEVVPLDLHRKRSVMVLFEPAAGLADGGAREFHAPPDEDIRDGQIARLKQQLAGAKERFLSVMEAQQTSREESQNTTEEALSANEELQSLNEELETAKEELQSTNEELITVNDELQSRNASLSQAHAFAMSIVETVRQPLMVLDTDLRIKIANQAFYRTFQASPREVEGQLIFSLWGGKWNLPGMRSSLDGLLRNGGAFPEFDVEQEFPGVGHRNLVVGGCQIDHLRMLLLAIDDVTDSKASQQALRMSEEHLRQAQKMEAVGRLAGGVAHDFNNLLTIILGYASLLSGELAGNEPALRQVNEIRTAGEMAASLTHQLLVFSRRQVLQPKVLNLNTLLADFDKMLRSLLGERIRVSIECATDLWQVKTDGGEMGRAIMNLWLNARDAMPDGGLLTIQTANRVLAKADLPKPELEPGRYVTMAVQDTGIGMSPELQSHVFEPFFTTKELGKGTGLGLATVLGIVEQSGGFIVCESASGEGTTFRIFLPAADAPRPDRALPGSLAQAPKGSEHILLVEDEEAVRRLARLVLEQRGYKVTEACNGLEALAFCKAHEGRIDLLLTDAMMPEMGGRELAAGAFPFRPDLKVVFMSGHTHDVVLKEGIEKGIAFLQKPFTAAGLAQKVRDTLDADGGFAGQF
ncbi:MAG: chemotaxis protein CheB [Acidobacteriota bacterium]